MLDVLLPRSLNNEYRGSKSALWLLGLVVAMKSVQSVAILVAGRSTAISADGIPLESFSPAAAQTVLAILAQGSLWRLFFCLLGALVLVRYRTAVPLMFALLGLNYIAARMALALVPMPHTETAVGSLVNPLLFLMMLVGLGLSLRRRDPR